MAFQTSKLVFFCKVKTNIYLFILNCCQHCRVSSTWVCCSEVTGLRFHCQDFKINELRCWRSSTGQFSTAAHPLLYNWPAESPHLCQTQTDRQTRGGHRAHQPSLCISLLFGERPRGSFCAAVPPLTHLTPPSPPVIHIYKWRHSPD